MATDMGLDEVKDVMMTLESNDGKKFTLQRHFAILSEVVKTALETDTSCVEMKLDVKGEVLERIVQWLNNHQGIEPAEIEKPVKSKVTAEWLPGREWDQKYIDGLAEPNIQVLYDVMLVSNLFLSLFSLFSFVFLWGLLLSLRMWFCVSLSYLDCTGCQLHGRQVSGSLLRGQTRRHAESRSLVQDSRRAPAYCQCIRERVTTLPSSPSECHVTTLDIAKL